jgi:acyl-CoA synthetase (NDP forming)
MARERGLGLSLWATTGNEADVQLADGLAWLARDPETDVIMAYMEGCRDGERLRAALALARERGKPVIMFKVGTSELGAAAAASHTASLAGNDAVYDAVFRQYGVLRAHTISDFFALAASASIAPIPRNRSLGLLTVSGGVGAMMADDASAAGLDVQPLSEAAQRQLLEWVPFAAPRNPVDITGQVTNDVTLLERSAELMMRDRNFASWLGFSPRAACPTRSGPCCAPGGKLRAAHPDTLLAICTLCSDARRAEMEALGCLVFSDPSAAIRCIGALASLADAPRAAPLPSACPAQPALQLPAGSLSEARSMELLAEAGMPVVPHQLVRTQQQAAQAVQALGGTIALKVASADIAHKSEVGGVALNLCTAWMRAPPSSAFSPVRARHGPKRSWTERWPRAWCTAASNALRACTAIRCSARC